MSRSIIADDAHRHERRHLPGAPVEMRQAGPDVAIALCRPLQARLRAPERGQSEAVADLLAVGWNLPREGLHFHGPRLEYLVYDPVARELAWLGSAEVLYVERPTDAPSPAPPPAQPEP